MKDRRVSSHSMKATVLSYAAKRGISVPDRLQLGYHTSQFQMSLVYSRDGAAAGLIILASLLKEIREGRFRPDETRSGRIIEVDKAPAIDLTEVKQEQNDVPELVESSSFTWAESPRCLMTIQKCKNFCFKNFHKLNPK